MKCNNCGADLFAGQFRCDKCGRIVDKSPKPTTQETQETEETKTKKFRNDKEK